MPTLYYLTLQATREGQAAHAHVHEIIKGLRQRGWNVVLFEPRYGGSIKSPPLLERLWGFVRVQLCLWFRGKPDILYIRWHFASWPTAFWARLRCIRVVQEINGPYEDVFLAWPVTRRFARLFTWLMRSQLRWADAIITVTPQLAEWVQKENGQAKVKVVVVPNGANTKLFHPFAKPNPTIPLRKPYVIFFGALASWQGIDVMLSAVDQPQWPQEVTLVIVGDGVERKKVEEAAKRSTRIQYLGPQRYKEIPGLVVGALAALSPQTGQRGRVGLLPLKVFEALACGVPVVVTDFPGMADIVKEGRCGLVIPPHDSEALAKSVAYLYEHPEERVAMGMRGRMLVEKDHSWDQRAEATAAVLEEILGYRKR